MEILTTIATSTILANNNLFVNGSEYLIIKDIVEALISSGLLIVAWRGLKTWREQIKGVKSYEVAYNLNYAVLKLRSAIKHVRNPAIWPSESYKAMQYAKSKYPDKQNDDLEKNSHPYVYEMRWDEINIALIELESHLLGAEVLWGKEILKLVDPLNKKIVELNIALQQNFNPDLRTKKPEEIDQIIYDGWGGDENDFSKSINDTIFLISEYIRDKLQK